VSPLPGDWQRLGHGLRESLRVLQSYRRSSVWDDLPPDHCYEVALQVGLRIAGFALQILAWHLEGALQGANGRAGPTVHRNGLAMDRPRLNEPSDAEMGRSQTPWLRFRLHRLGLEELSESTLDELILGLSTERGLAIIVDVPFGHDEQRHAASLIDQAARIRTRVHAATGASMHHPSSRQLFAGFLVAATALGFAVTGPRVDIGSINPIWYVYPIVAAAGTTMRRDDPSRWPLLVRFVGYAGAMYGAGAAFVLVSTAFGTSPGSSWLNVKWDVGPVGFVLFAIGAPALAIAAHLFHKRLDAGAGHEPSGSGGPR
jgi:hypothetical protein